MTIRASRFAPTCLATLIAVFAFGFAQADEPWANLGFYKSVALTEKWQHFVEHFIARIDDLNGRIHFDAGESAISFEVGSMRLRSQPDGVMVEPSSVTMGGQR